MDKDNYDQCPHYTQKTISQDNTNYNDRGRIVRTTTVLVVCQDCGAMLSKKESKRVLS